MFPNASRSRTPVAHLLVTVAIVMTTVLAMPSAHARAATPSPSASGGDFTGHWDIAGGGGFTVLTQTAGGAFTATSDFGPTYPIVKGQASGGHYSFDVLNGANYVSHNVGTYKGNTLQGSFSDSNGTTRSYTGTRMQLPPTATFISVQDDVDPFSFAFDGSNSLANAPGATLTQWSWDFGDASTGSGSTAKHRYASGGHFNVKLTVTDSSGGKDTYTVGLDPSALVVRLDPGVTNGKLFGVDVSVRNGGTTPLSNVAFVDPGGVVANTAVAVATTAGSITEFAPLSDTLPTTLQAGEDYTATVTFAVVQQGGIDLQSAVTSTDPSGAKVAGHTGAKVQIGKHPLAAAEIDDMYGGILIDGAIRAGNVINAARKRYADVMGWVSSAAGAALPGWLTGSVANGSAPPPGSGVPPVAGWKVLAARAAGLGDNAFAWLPDNPAPGLQAYLTFEAHAAAAAARVVGSSATGAVNSLANAAEFYGRLSVGDPAFQAAAKRELQGVISDVGTAAAPKIQVIGAILAASHDDPNLVGDYELSPVLQQFTQQTTATIDATLNSANARAAALVQLAKTDPNAAAGQLGDLTGTTFTTIGVAVATNEFGGAMVSRLGKVVDAAMPSAVAGDSLDAALAVTQPGATVAGTAAQQATATGARATLESLGQETVITPAQLQQLGGFYAADAPKVQKIIANVKAKYGVDIEIQVRPGNPASLQYYADGTGVPKPQWIKPKATEWTDVVLGAPPETLGRATLFQPTLPSPATMAQFTQAEQQAITARFATQKKLYTTSLDPKGSFQQLLADSQTPAGASVPTGLGTGAQNVTGLRYALEDVPGHPGVKYIKDETVAGKSKYVLSDADYQAVVNAKTGKNIPAYQQRGAIETDVMRQLGKDTVSFGGHGWSHAGIDLASEFSETWLEFATGSMSRDDAAKTIAWFLGQNTQPAWLQAMAKKLGRAVGVDDLLAAFKPGQFVIKFNGTTMRVGYAAGLR